MTDQIDDEVPACYGKLDVVFPRGDDGLRHSPESCLPCFFKTRCLRTAMEGAEGLQVEEERTDRAYESGVIGFFERWSRKKELSRKNQKKNTAK
jgi:hypothetical protein